MNLEQELQATVGKYRRSARQNYYCAFILYFIAVASSVASTVSALLDNINGGVLATMTAIPGLVILILATFKINERARWYFDKKNQLNALFRRVAIDPAGVDKNDIIARWNAIDSEMEKSWPSFGNVSVQTIEK